MNEVKIKNAITNKELKDKFIKEALKVLKNKKLMKRNTKNITIEFSYLIINENNQAETTLKVVIPKKLFKEEKVYYMSLYNDKLIILQESFSESLFLKLREMKLFFLNEDKEKMNYYDYVIKLD